MIRPSAVRTAQEVKDVPNEPHYVALVEKSFSYDDGYGERGQASTSTARSLDYVVIGDEEQLKAWIIDTDVARYGAPKVYKIMKVTPVTVTTRVEITLG